MIMRCICSVRFWVKVNGTDSKHFSPSRGLRQGDPLSPYLFLFCVEVFSFFLKQAHAARELAGVSFGGIGPTITHLLFADDSTVFLKASDSNLQALKDVSQKYERCSGKKVNFQKSSIYFGKGCNEQVKSNLKIILDIQCEALLKKYLGLPTVVGRKKNGVFKNLIARSRGKVSGWNGLGLSKAGKEALVKSVLHATSTYTMAVFNEQVYSVVS